MEPIGRQEHHAEVEIEEVCDIVEVGGAASRNFSRSQRNLKEDLDPQDEVGIGCKFSQRWLTCGAPVPQNWLTQRRGNLELVDGEHDLEVRWKAGNYSVCQVSCVLNCFA